MKLHLQILMSLLFCSCAVLEKNLGLEEDNLGEELVEDAIKGRTGLILISHQKPMKSKAALHEKQMGKLCP